MDNERLNRIEQKLDRLVDVVESIARVEEKLISAADKAERLEERVSKVEDELLDVAKLARQNSGVANFANKAFWLLLGGIVSLGVWVVRTVIVS